MNTVEIRAYINQKLSRLSQEQLNSVWQFIDSLESATKNENRNKKTVLERMGGYPASFLEGSENLSDRDTRKKIIADRIQQRHRKRHKETP